MYHSLMIQGWIISWTKEKNETLREMKGKEGSFTKTGVRLRDCLEGWKYDRERKILREKRREREDETWGNKREREEDWNRKPEKRRGRRSHKFNDRSFLHTLFPSITPTLFSLLLSTRRFLTQFHCFLLYTQTIRKKTKKGETIVSTHGVTSCSNVVLMHLFFCSNFHLSNLCLTPLWSQQNCLEIDSPFHFFSFTIWHFSPFPADSSTFPSQDFRAWKVYYFCIQSNNVIFVPNQLVQQIATG